MNTNLIHMWLKDPSLAREPEIDEPASEMCFVPVEIEGTVAVPMVDEAPRQGEAA